MGSSASKPQATTATSTVAPPPGCPMHEQSNTNMKGSIDSSSNQTPPPGCPMHASPNPDASKCPVQHKPASKSGTVYNVYSQEIDPNNMMPKNLNQQPAADQSQPLSVNRQRSSIPKGGVDGHWDYPSEQMFYNALKRKNKADGVTESDMSVVIAIHNGMNERTWKKVLEWEQLHAGEHDEGGPRLRRFMGKPYELSPKAKLKSMVGFGYPFDRHDWTVNRGEKEVRYIIDYYYNPKAAEAAKSNPLAPIWVDVRPELTGFSAVIDRLKMLPSRLSDAWERGFWYSDGLDPKSMPKEVHRALSLTQGGNQTQATPQAPVARSFNQQDKQNMVTLERINSKCAPLLEKMKTSDSEDDRRSASVALNFCMAQMVCPREADMFLEALNEQKDDDSTGEGGGAEEKAFGAMTKCVVDKMQRIRESQQLASATFATSHQEGNQADDANQRA